MFMVKGGLSISDIGSWHCGRISLSCYETHWRCLKSNVNSTLPAFGVNCVQSRNVSIGYVRNVANTALLCTKILFKRNHSCFVCFAFRKHEFALKQLDVVVLASL